MHGDFYVSLHMPEVACRCLAFDKPDLVKSSSVFLGPIERRVASSVQTEIELAHHAFIGRFPIFNKNLDVSFALG